MDKKEMLWNKFMLTGSVDDYLKYCISKNGEEKADELKHGRFDNQGEKFGRTEQDGNRTYS